ncbi:MAG: cytochrome P450 [Anaerolineae bacterium]
MANGIETQTQTGWRAYGVGAVPSLAKDPLSFFIHSLHERGDLVPVNLGPTKLLLVHHPDYVRYVLQDNWRNYGKGSMWVAIRKLVGNGMLGSEGDLWLRQRRLMQPAFHRQRLAGLVNTVSEVIAETLADWKSLSEKNQPIEIAHAMADLTMKIIVRTMFGTGISNEETHEMVDAYTKALKLMNVRMWTFFLPDFIPLPGDTAFRETIQQIDRAVYGFIKERRENPNDNNDLLNMLLDARDEETGEGMSDQQVRDEVFTVFMAGHETSATVMTWVWYLIWQHPDVERRLMRELADVLDGRTPTFDDLPRLTYTRQIIDESVRMFPPAWLIPRSTVSDDAIGGMPVKAGTTVLISPYVVHRHPDFWEDAERFDPDRFAPDRTHTRHAYIPFGEGPRVCIGNNFAIMEMQLMIAMIAQTYHLSLKPGVEIKPTTMPVLRPNNDLLMHLRPRTVPAPGTWQIATETGEHRAAVVEDADITAE